MKLRAVRDCQYDAVSLGEVMLRLDPGDMRIHTARAFQAWEGGGEYNVTRGLRRCFGLRTAVVTAFADNAIGQLLDGLIHQGGVDTSHVRWVAHDGIGRTVRNGLNFTERGYGVRGAVGVSDRGLSAASQVQPGDVDWDALFGEHGARWFHTGGVYAGLSESTPAVIIEAMESARRHGTIVSYDLNYRPSLWQTRGGKVRAQEVNREIANYVDVLLGIDRDFTACLGSDAPDTEPTLEPLETDAFRQMVCTATRQLSHLQVVATTRRAVRTASRNDWGAIAWSATEGFAEATHRPELEILDRVGGGDGFASGLIYGLLSGEPLAMAVELGAAHGALAMTTPGDNSMATLEEVRRLASGGGAQVHR